MVVSTRRMIGTLIGFAGQLLDRDGLVGVLILGDDVEREILAGFFQHALRLLGLLQNVVDLGEGGDLGHDAPAQQQADLVDHHQLAGIGDGYNQPAVVLLFQRHEVVAEHVVHFDLAKQLVLDVKVLQIDELAAIAPRQVFTVLDLVTGRDAAYENCLRFCHRYCSLFAFRFSLFAFRFSLLALSL